MIFRGLFSYAIPQRQPHIIEEQRVFRFVESFDPRTKIDTEEEGSVRVAQAMDVGYGGRLARLPKVFKDP